jgi:hypothetical protein
MNDSRYKMFIILHIIIVKIKCTDQLLRNLVDNSFEHQHQLHKYKIGSKFYYQENIQEMDITLS